MSKISNNKNFYKFIFITNCANRNIKDYVKTISPCFPYITSIQIREKNSSEEFISSLFFELQEITKPYQLPIIINDNMYLAYKLKASGVHLGQSDGKPQKARELLGDKALIGISVSNIKELEIANNLAVNYIGIGAIFQTSSKDNCSAFLGLTGLKELSKISSKQVVAIGGINLDNTKDVMKYGANGIAVISVLDRNNNQVEAKELSKIINNEISQIN